MWRLCRGDPNSQSNRTKALYEGGKFGKTTLELSGHALKPRCTYGLIPFCNSDTLRDGTVPLVLRSLIGMQPEGTMVYMLASGSRVD